VLLVVEEVCAKTEAVGGAADLDLLVSTLPAAEKMLVAGVVDVADGWAPDEDGAAGVLVGKKLADGGVDFSEVKDEKTDDCGVAVFPPRMLESLFTVEGVAAVGVLIWLPPVAKP
jgi:hypothetical protein